MPFTTPVPWEAVEYYDGEEGRDVLQGSSGRGRPLPAGEARHAQSRIVLERNPNWYGLRHPEWRAPGAVYPTRGGARRRGARPARPGLCGPRAPVSRPRRVPHREGGHPDLQQVPPGLLRRLGDRSGELRQDRPRGRPLAGDGGARHAAREVGGSRRLLHRLQHGRPGGGDARRRARPQAAPGDEPGGRRPASTRGSSTTAAAFPRSRRCPPASSATRPTTRTPSAGSISSARKRLLVEAGLRQGHRSGHRQAAAPDLRSRRHLHARPRSLPVLRQRLEPPGTRRGDRRDHLQPVPGEGAQGRLPDLHVGLDRRLSRPGELPVPALGAARATRRATGPTPRTSRIRATTSSS